MSTFQLDCALRKYLPAEFSGASLEAVLGEEGESRYSLIRVKLQREMTSAAILKALERLLKEKDMPPIQENKDHDTSATTVSASSGTVFRFGTQENETCRLCYTTRNEPTDDFNLSVIEPPILLNRQKKRNIIPLVNKKTA